MTLEVRERQTILHPFCPSLLLQLKIMRQNRRLIYNRVTVRHLKQRVKLEETVICTLKTREKMNNMVKQDVHHLEILPPPTKTEFGAQDRPLLDKDKMTYQNITEIVQQTFGLESLTPLLSSVQHNILATDAKYTSRKWSGTHH